MTVRVVAGDCREALAAMPAGSAHCAVTSPPYFGLRDYGVAGQIGLEATVEEYVAELVAVFREVRRVLRDDGTLWLNLGDSYAANRGCQAPGSKHAIKPKDLIGVPWAVAFALRADGWWLRQEIIWHKPNPMPESIADRCTKAHEHVFLLSKSERYYYDQAAIAEPATPVNGMDETGFKSAADFGGKNADGGVRGHRKTGWKTPDGWDTSKGRGGHGSFHRDGREAGHTGYRHSGNTRRRTAAERGCPTGGGRNQCSHVPWDGNATPTRNKRSVWTVATSPFPEAHFATFPPALVEPCVRAGTSERGCCSKCGAPWGRAVETNNPSKADAGPDARGWGAGCGCGAGVVPCTVLDPFAGAGTTGLVADRLARDAVLVELKPEYAAMIERRLRDDAGMFASVSAERGGEVKLLPEME